MLPTLLLSMSMLTTLVYDVTGALVYSRKFYRTRKSTTRKTSKTTLTTTEKSTVETTEMKVFPWNTLQYYETIGPPDANFEITFIRNPNGTDAAYYYPNRTAEERAALIAQRKGRALNNHWCRCGSCPAMTTDEDSVCCREEYYCDRLVRDMEDTGEALCYADTALTYMALRPIELDHYRVLFLAAEKRHLEAKYNVDFRNRTARLWRWLAYRYIIRGLNVVTPYNLGRFNATVPACIVKAVRGEFPEPDKKYPDTGWSVFGSIRLPG